MEKTALIIIDVQKGLDDPSLGKRNNPQAESNIASLMSTWRQNEWPVIHIKHCSVEPNSLLRPELPGNEFKDEVKPLPDEQQFSKTVNSAFIGTDLEHYLRQHDILFLIMVGLTTDHCVSTSVRMAANLGFNVSLISDATATFERKGHDGVLYSAEQIHNINLLSLDGEFCQLLSTAEMLSKIAAEK